MKVKRCIKGFIYLMPVIFVFTCALASICGRIAYRPKIDIIHESSGQTRYTYGLDETSVTMAPVYYGIQYFNYLCDDISYDLKEFIYPVTQYLGIEENDGTFYSFVVNFIAYEIFAIITCAILDVIFLIPEFYNKIEDKYIKGGKKRE